MFTYFFNIAHLTFIRHSSDIIRHGFDIKAGFMGSIRGQNECLDRSKLAYIGG